ncbi:MAG: helix-turn-helix domain-containing protein [Acidobacteria bacterium]|nr:helix-turn-helix domain-containing protein [Acidobacteriota bacterium]
MRRRIEIITVERERIVRAANGGFCPVCKCPGALLSTAEAASLAGVKASSVRRWLARRLAHGVKTRGGRYRVCKNSLFDKIDGRADRPV